MRHQDKAGTVVACQLKHEVGDGGARAGVETARGFVGKDQRGAPDERPCQRDSLLFAAGQSGGKMRQALVEPDAGKQIGRAAPQGRFRGIGHSAELKRKQHIFQGRQMRQKLKRLEHESEVTRPQAGSGILVQFMKRMTEQVDLPAIAPVQAGKQPQQGRFTGSGRTEDGQTGTTFQRQGNIAQDHQRSLVCLRQFTAQPACHDRGAVVGFWPHVGVLLRRAKAGLGCIALLMAVCVNAQGAPAAASGVLVMGDSLSAEYGLSRGSGWVALLEERLRQRGLPYPVVNASVSGETSDGGRARIDALLRRHHPAIVILELGANDGLRGLPPAGMRQNLADIVHRIRAQGATVVLVGMRLPPNFGDAYAQAFHRAFTDLAAAEHLAFVPFLLNGFADDDSWFQADHLHPLAKAEPRMLETVWKTLEPLVTVPAR